MLQLIGFELAPQHRLDHPFQKGLAIFVLRIEHRDDEISHAARATQVGRELVNTCGDQQPEYPASQAWVGHHGLDLAGETTFGFVCIRANGAELCVGLIHKNQHLGKGFQNASKSLENDIGLTKPLTTQVLQHQHHHVHFGSDGFKDEGLAAADRATNRGPGQ